jgi:imidazolonepropionase-like amidohydrolase
MLPVAIGEFVAAGIPTPETLASATSAAAEACGLGDRKGRLGVNYDADILVVDGDPFGDIASLSNVLAVLVHGQRVV